MTDFIQRALVPDVRITLTQTLGNRESIRLMEQTVTLSGFYDRLRNHVLCSDKNTAEAVVPGRVGPCPVECRNLNRVNSTNCGGNVPHRLAANVTELHALFIDIDHWTVEQRDAYLDGLTFEYFAYSSFSHTAEQPKFRIVFPFAAPVATPDPAHWRRRVWPELLKRVGLSVDEIDASCSDTSRLYYLPSKQRLDSPTWTREGRGPLLTVPDIAPPVPLAVVPVTPLPARDYQAELIATALRAQADYPEDVALVERALSNQPIAAEGARHEALRRFTWLLAAALPDLSRDSAMAFLGPVISQLGDERDWESEVERLYDGATHKVLGGYADDSAAQLKALRAEQDGTDFGFAKRFVRLYRDRCVSLGDRRGWMQWDGKRWVKSAAPLQLVFGLAETYEQDLETLKRDVEALRSGMGPVDLNAPQSVIQARARLQERIDGMEARIKGFRKAVIKSILSERTARHVLAAASELLFREPDSFDASEYLLNCPNGTVDLRTGELRPHSPSDYITLCAAVDYNPTATAPVFSSTVATALPDGPVQRFLQRAIGYGVTGSLKAQCMFLLVGEGGNGKSTILGGIAKALGEYAGTAPKQLVASTRSDGSHQLADLKGLRFTQVMELNNREMLAVDRVKAVTGGDPITAARKFENQITFVPKCKLFLPCNEKPRISDVDHAIWRRLHVIPFNVSFTKSGIADAELISKFGVELTGILAWIVAGAREWYARGLQPPESVQAETLTYQTEEDIVHQFYNECVRQSPSNAVPGSTMYARFRQWCGDSGVQPFSIQRFAKRFERFVTKRRTESRAEWVGVELLS